MRQLCWQRLHPTRRPRAAAVRAVPRHRSARGDAWGRDRCSQRQRSRAIRCRRGVGARAGARQARRAGGAERTATRGCCRARARGGAAATSAAHESGTSLLMVITCIGKNIHTQMQKEIEVTTTRRTAVLATAVCTLCTSAGSAAAPRPCRTPHTHTAHTRAGAPHPQSPTGACTTKSHAHSSSRDTPRRTPRRALDSQGTRPLGRLVLFLSRPLLCSRGMRRALGGWVLVGASAQDFKDLGPHAGRGLSLSS